MGSFPQCARSVARRLLRMLLASLTDPDVGVVPGVGPLRRTIGVQSQVHYTWHDSEPRFKAGNQGFQRSGVNSDFGIPECVGVIPGARRAQVSTPHSFWQ